jgi:TRAP-type C4-dicarboxylate transport system permease small subunit
MTQLTLFTRRVNGVFLALSGLMAAAILAALAYDLVARNVFDAPTVWALDTSRFLLLFLFFFALAPALESGAHVSVDILEHYMGPRARRVMRVVAHSLTLVFGAFLMWQICRTTYEAFIENSLFPTVVPVRLKHVYWIAPLGTAQFLLTGLALLAEDLQWKG